MTKKKFFLSSVADLEFPQIIQLYWSLVKANASLQDFLQVKCENHKYLTYTI